MKAHYSSSAIKAKNAADHGAVGVITIDDPVLEQLYSFHKRVRDLAIPEFRWGSTSGANPTTIFLNSKAVRH